MARRQGVCPSRDERIEAAARRRQVDPSHGERIQAGGQWPPDADLSVEAAGAGGDGSVETFWAGGRRSRGPSSALSF